MKMIVSLSCIELETNFISKSWRWFIFFFSPCPCNPNYIIYTPVFNRFPVYKLEKCQMKGPSAFYYFTIVPPLLLPVMSLLICFYIYIYKLHVLVCMCWLIITLKRDVFEDNNHTNFIMFIIRKGTKFSFIFTDYMI